MPSLNTERLEKHVNRQYKTSTKKNKKSKQVLRRNHCIVSLNFSSN